MSLALTCAFKPIADALALGVTAVPPAAVVAVEPAAVVAVQPAPVVAVQATPLTRGEVVSLFTAGQDSTEEYSACGTHYTINLNKLKVIDIPEEVQNEERHQHFHLPFLS
jgi:hypothetical protein